MFEMKNDQKTISFYILPDFFVVVLPAGSMSPRANFSASFTNIASEFDVYFFGDYIDAAIHACCEKRLISYEALFQNHQILG